MHNPKSAQRSNLIGVWVLLVLFAVVPLPREASAQVTVTYSYDQAGQLENAAYGSAFAIDYKFDSSGNLTQYTRGGATALPVELVAFDATYVDSEVRLSWSTATEIDNAGFEVEHASQSDEWGVLAYLEGSGNSAKPVEYVYAVVNLMPGPHRFRLKQIDFDGSFEYSSEIEITVEVPGTHLLTDVYPNPFGTQAFFEVAVASEQRVQVVLFDPLGRTIAKVYDGFLPGDKTKKLELSASQLPAGLYFMRVQGEVFSDTRRFVVVR